MQGIMDHIVLNAEDVEALVRFYTNVVELAPERVEEYRHLPTDEIGHRELRALVRDVADIDLREHLEELAGEVRCGAGTARSEGEFTRFSARKRNQFSDRLRGDRDVSH